MTQEQNFYSLLAEAVSPLSHSLAAGLLIRPVPAPFLSLEGDNGDTPSLEAAHALCHDLERMLNECVPAMKEAMSDLDGCELDALEEIVDELASPALELVDMARRVWESPLPPEAESARALLATLAEAPVTQLLQWVLEIMHTAIDPWSVAEDPDNPSLDFVLRVPDQPVREALKHWRADHPGLLPDILP
jgi:hypothetical protein